MYKRQEKNTRFFHLRASQRKKRNKIFKLRKADGSLTEDVNEMKNLITTFYKDLYTLEGTQDMERVLQTVPVKVSNQMNEQLMKDFIEGEVKQTLF